MTKREFIEQATLAFFANPSPQYTLETITDTADQIYGEDKQQEPVILLNENGNEIGRITPIYPTDIRTLNRFGYKVKGDTLNDNERKIIAIYNAICASECVETALNAIKELFKEK